MARWCFEWKEWLVKRMARIEGMLTKVRLSWDRDVGGTTWWLLVVVSMAWTIAGGVWMMDD